MQYHYRVPPQNSHHKGVFDETERRWRQTCALNKASHVGQLHKRGEVANVLSYTPASFALTLATAGLSIDRLRSFDHSLAVQSFFSGKPIGVIKLALRSSLLYLSEGIATKIFRYHCGALCRVGPAR